MLRAFFDDSTSEDGDRRLFMAGYLQRVDVWERFSEAWNAELRASPSIRYFKMVDANNLRGQFRHWSVERRDEKVERLARIVRHFHLVSLEYSVSRVDYAELVAPYMPHGLRTPYYACFSGILSALSQLLIEHKIEMLANVVFDDQEGLGTDAALMYDYAKDREPQLTRAIRGTPKFANDRDLPQIQAADMLAWHIRRADEKRPNDARPANLSRLRGDGEHYVRRIERADLAAVAEQIKPLNAAAIVPGKRTWVEVRANIEDFKPRKQVSLLHRPGRGFCRLVARVFGP